MMCELDLERQLAARHEAPAGGFRLLQGAGSRQTVAGREQ